MENVCGASRLCCKDGRNRLDGMDGIGNDLYDWRASDTPLSFLLR